MSTALAERRTPTEQTGPDGPVRPGSRSIGLPRPLVPIGVQGRWRPSPRPAPVGTEDLMLLAEVATGRTIPVIGDRLGISERTVRRRLRSICDDLGVGTPIEAVAWAARRRLV